tara:strand:- start:4298 stop:5539 length:1242 start_codon:yes stop_codon:yes gene_type:complete
MGTDMAFTVARNGLWAALVLLLGSLAAYAVLVGKPAPSPEVPPEAGPPEVEVIIAEPRRQALSVQTQGTVRPTLQVRVVSRVSGRVERVSPRFAVGGFFAAGEELVKIEDVDYQLAIARAESQVAAAQQRLAEERGRARQAEREWRDLGTAEANALFLRKPQVAAAEAALKASEADLQAAQLDLARTEISVPFNGRVSEKLVDVGQFVTAGSPIASVYGTDAVEVRLPLTGRQVALLDLPLSYEEDKAFGAGTGAPVVLRAVFANREWRWQGRIVRTDASIDEDSRMVYAVAEVAEPFTRDADSERPPLSPGLFVHATISGKPLPNVSGLPRTALLSGDAVMLVDEGGVARKRPVHILQSDADTVWAQGLQAGERVIVREVPRVVAGVEVRVSSIAQAPARAESLTSHARAGG